MAKKKPCKEPECPYPKFRNFQRCGWHWALKQPIEVQVDAAEWRLAQHVASGRPARSRVPKEEWPEGQRFCSGCQSFIPLFYCSGSKCKPCASRAAHAGHIARTYGLSEEAYRELLAVQGDRCAICRCQAKTRRLVVDHDHESGRVRGMLCTRCNHDLLGAAHDSLEILRAAVTYLESPPYDNITA